MNLWDIQQRKWSQKLLDIIGSDSEALRHKLGEVEQDGGRHLGKIHTYFTSKYHFSKGIYPR